MALVAVFPDESRTCTVNEYVPGDVGAPLIAVVLMLFAADAG
jgi:hypothetical protein